MDINKIIANEINIRTEQEKMTLVEVEDIYRPFRPKRRTRAGIARENGLEPLANTKGEIISKATDPENASVYMDYYDYREPIEKVANHRILAMDRGEKEETM